MRKQRYSKTVSLKLDWRKTDFESSEVQLDSNRIPIY